MKILRVRLYTYGLLFRINDPELYCTILDLYYSVLTIDVSVNTITLNVSDIMDDLKWFIRHSIPITQPGTDREDSIRSKLQEQGV